MAKKRKSANAGLDEVERTLYSSFCTAANSISQLYTQSQHQQKLAFQAGERAAVEKLYTWLQRARQSNSNPSCADILNYLQNELDGEEMTISPGPQFYNPMIPQQQLSLQLQHQPSNLQTPANAGVYGSMNNAPVSRRPVGGFEQLYEFASEERVATAAAQTQAITASSGQLHYQSVTPVYYNQDAPSQLRETQPFADKDSSMDMHADGMYQNTLYR